MICSRCGIETPRLTLSQTRCPDCQRQVDDTIRRDTARRSRRVASFGKDLSGAVR